jgi:hypothetical protein
MMLAPVFLGFACYAYFADSLVWMYGLMAIWYVWGLVGNLLTARHDYYLFGPKIKSWIESSTMFNVWGIKTIAYYVGVTCVLSYSLMVSAVNTIIGSTLFI